MVWSCFGPHICCQSMCLVMSTKKTCNEKLEGTNEQEDVYKAFKP